MSAPARIAVVIPCFKVKASILDVIATIPTLVEKIIVVDDACPQESGKHVQASCADSRVEVLFNAVNCGVGGAVIRGYQRALELGYDIIVKLDGDAQMDGALIPFFVKPIEQGHADYSKGNRFYHPRSLQNMPPLRLVSNALLSFMTKLSSGYWNSFDPTNGYTAISAAALKRLPLDRISQRYFFESDMLFRLNTIQAVAMDIPIDAVYAEEISNLKFCANIAPFLIGNLRNTIKRIVYNYYLRNFSLASLQLLIGLPLMLFGLSYGVYHWVESAQTHQVASAGTVMVAALPIIVGFQLLLSFLNYDINSVPRYPISRSLR
ncbi:MAG: glycosyltransferase family 2 protein [Rickettsiales bacterium]|nr:glycosyltransferase family 2 protein [Rickettsiales bacterium]